MKPHRILYLSLALVAAAGCAGIPASEEGVAAESPKRERDVIERDEIMASPHRQVDLLQAIRGLRPHFLAAPTANRTRSYPTQLYVDGVRQQAGLGTLSTIPAAAVQRVRYLDPGRAESELGSTASGGAVLVTTIEGRAP